MSLPEEHSGANKVSDLSSITGKRAEVIIEGGEVNPDEIEQQVRELIEGMDFGDPDFDDDNYEFDATQNEKETETESLHTLKFSDKLEELQDSQEIPKSGSTLGEFADIIDEKEIEQAKQNNRLGGIIFIVVVFIWMALDPESVSGFFFF